MPYRCIKPLCDSMGCVMCNCAVSDYDTMNCEHRVIAPTQDVSAIPIAWASSVGWRANQLMSAEQYRQCLPKNRADFDVPLYGPEALGNYRRLADESQQDAARFRMLLQQHRHWLGVFRCDPDGAPSDSLDHVELRATLDQLIAQERSE